MFQLKLQLAANLKASTSDTEQPLVLIFIFTLQRDHFVFINVHRRQSTFYFLRCRWIQSLGIHTETSVCVCVLLYWKGEEQNRQCDWDTKQPELTPLSLYSGRWRSACLSDSVGEKRVIEELWEMKSVTEGETSTATPKVSFLLFSLWKGRSGCSGGGR